jgi:site-specific DNA-cytosine methylase
MVAHSLTGVGSEDGTGRGTPIIAFDARNETSSDDVTGTLQAKKTGGWSLNYRPVVAVRTAQTSSNGWGVNEEETSYTLDGAQGQAVAFRTNQTGAQGPIHSIGVTDSLAQDHPPAVAFTERGRRDGVQTEAQEELAYALRDASQGGGGAARVAGAMGVRRLTPVECERLMGWSDNWTAVGASGKEMSDSTRYRMCGNGVVANVSEWIAHRIAEVCRG